MVGWRHWQRFRSDSYKIACIVSRPETLIFASLEIEQNTKPTLESQQTKKPKFGHTVLTMVILILATKEIGCISGSVVGRCLGWCSLQERDRLSMNCAIEMERAYRRLLDSMHNMQVEPSQVRSYCGKHRFYARIETEEVADLREIHHRNRIQRQGLQGQPATAVIPGVTVKLEKGHAAGDEVIVLDWTGQVCARFEVSSQQRLCHR